MRKDILNKEQKEAVETISGPLLVLAGAGTGKTRVITYRIANMLKSWISPHNILALTFTNKAAREMRERIANLVDKNSAEKLFVGTFHAFSIHILRKEIKNIKSLHPGFTIADEVDQKSLYKQVMAELNLINEKIDLNVFRSAVSKAKNNLLSPKKYKLQADGYLENIVAKVYDKYQEKLTLQNMVDFDDILMKLVLLLQDNSEVLKKYRDIYKYILVDEFQDTNFVQFELVRILAGENNNICVVGDDDQSIYGWRGAKIENILSFPKNFKNTKVIKLEQNYRSTNNILEAANSFIAGNSNRHGKNLWSGRGGGEKILFHPVDSDLEEADFISKQIYRIIFENPDVKYSDIAVLYRSNHQSRLFEKAFKKDSIPYRLVGSKSFYERKEIRDAAAYLKLCVNPRDDQSFLRIIGVPSRGIGSKTIDIMRKTQSEQKIPLTAAIYNESIKKKLSGKASTSAKTFSDCLKKWSAILKETDSLSDKIKKYFEEIGFLNGFQKIYKNIDEAEMRRDNVIEFINAVAQYETEEKEEASLAGFLEAYCLADDNDKVDEDEDSGNSVTMLTVHAAKGLEFPYIFLVGLEEGLFPNYRAVDEGNLDEERRLFYVAVTRAKEKIIMSNAKTRFRYGKAQKQRSSSFINEIPEELFEELNRIPVEDNSVKKAFAAFYNQFS
ncbi:MAG: UvrD-helicase domain-containing protein [Victivallales bacterium]|nr:UvrD-helicase domain-containing protein [Victivallales bacterium]